MTKKVVVVEPFYSGSHKSWTDGVIRLLQKQGNDVTTLTLPGRHWKWRMQGSASYLAEKLNELNILPDVLLASDMLDLSVFAGVARKSLVNTKLVVYFHENQLTYPWSPTDDDVQLKRDQAYGLINLRTALVADEVYFNSEYHKNSFISAIDKFISQFPDAVNKGWVKKIEDKSAVLYLGMNLNELLHSQKEEVQPVLLWNHRWEYDKNPEGFYEAISKLRKDGLLFKLIVCGEKNKKYPELFDRIESEFEEEIIHFGYAKSKEAYFELLKKATILPITSKQDFFGGSVVEAIAAGCVPVIPNRLAYPEHLPKDYKNKYVRNEDDWYSLLKDVVVNLSDYQKDCSELKTHVARYDWGRMEESYLKIVK